METETAIYTRVSSDRECQVNEGLDWNCLLRILRILATECQITFTTNYQLF